MILSKLKSDKKGIVLLALFSTHLIYSFIMWAVYGAFLSFFNLNQLFLVIVFLVLYFKFDKIKIIMFVITLILLSLLFLDSAIFTNQIVGLNNNDLFQGGRIVRTQATHLGNRFIIRDKDSKILKELGTVEDNQVEHFIGYTTNRAGLIKIEDSYDLVEWVTIEDFTSDFLEDIPEGLELKEDINE